MRSHLQSILIGLTGWAIVTPATAAELCPSTLPNYELDHTEFRTGGVTAVSRFSDTEIEQGERLREAIAQQGYETAMQQVGSTVSADTAAYVLVRFGQSLALPDSVLADALALLETVPVSERRDTILYDLTWDALWRERDAPQQGNLELAAQAVGEIQDARIRLGMHSSVFENALEQGRDDIAHQQWQQAVAFLDRQPTHRAVVWAELAATAQTVGDAPLADALSEQALTQLVKANRRPQSETIFAGPGYRQSILDKLARPLARAQQFDAAYQLATQIEENPGETEFAIAAAQIAAGETDVGLAQILTLDNRSFYAEHLTLVHDLAVAGDIDCSIAVFFAPAVNRQALDPLDEITGETFLLWAQAGRQDALWSLGMGINPVDSGFSSRDLLRVWVQAEAWETALELINGVPSAEARYSLLRRLAQTLTEAEDYAAAAQVRLASVALAEEKGLEIEPNRFPWEYSRPFRYPPNTVVTRNYAAVRQQLRDYSQRSTNETDGDFAELVAARDRLLALTHSPNFDEDGIFLLADVALALYQGGHPEAAEQTLQQLLFEIPPSVLRAELSAPTLGDYPASLQAQSLFARFQTAGWYDGIAEWLTNPVVGYGEDLNFIALDLPLTKQGEAILALAQAATANGNSQAALRVLPYLSRTDERVRVGAMVAAAMMNEERDRILAEDPNSAILQLDLIEAEISPLALSLPDSLLKVRAYLAISEAYITLESIDKAEHWLTMAVALMQRLQTQVES